jgi:uncharacterized membrane protein (UPF0127 family)
MQTGTVTIGEKQWQVSVAVTPQELANGLSGLESMPDGAGMLFDLGSERAVQVTTEAMLFSIDIIFVSEALQVVDVVLGAPPGYIITQETPVRYFLELNAGEAESVETDDNVSIDYTTEEEPPLIGELPGVTGFMQLALTAAVMGLFVGGMLKTYTRAAVGKPKSKPAFPVPRGERTLPQTKKDKPTRDDIDIGSWAERDRLGIWITDKYTNKTVAEWWDEDAQEMFEQGFFKPGDIRHQTITGRAFEESVLDYAESVGILAGSGKYLPQTVRDAYYWTGINKDTGEIAESLAPYTSSGRALRGGKAFASRHWRGDIILIEVWTRPYRYSAKLKISAVDTETIAGSKSAAVIPTKLRPMHHVSKDGLDFLADSPEFLAYTIDDIGYREKLDSAFQKAITRVNRRS